MLSKSAVSKSSSPNLHAVAVANIARLYRAAIYEWLKADGAGDQNIAAIHRFFALMLTADNRLTMIKLTVK
jgi:hypothetical protein